MAAQPAATVILEACGSSHYWGRKFQSFGHDVKLLPSRAVRPYVQRSKTDRADVKGMLEASRNTNIHPVPIKSVSQQQLTTLHRVRSGWIQTRTMRINGARSLLAEMGIVFPQGAYKVADRLRGIVEDAETPLPPAIREVLHQMVLDILESETRIEAADRTPYLKLRELRFDDDEPVRPAREKALINVDLFGRCGDWHPARGFHHGPERLAIRSTLEAEDTTAV